MTSFYPQGTTVAKWFVDPTTGLDKLYYGQVVDVDYTYQEKCWLYLVRYDDDGDEEHVLHEEMERIVVKEDGEEARENVTELTQHRERRVTRSRNKPAVREDDSKMTTKKKAKAPKKAKPKKQREEEVVEEEVDSSDEESVEVLKPTKRRRINLHMDDIQLPPTTRASRRSTANASSKEEDAEVNGKTIEVVEAPNKPDTNEASITQPPESLLPESPEARGDDPNVDVNDNEMEEDIGIGDKGNDEEPIEPSAKPQPSLANQSEEASEEISTTKKVDGVQKEEVQGEEEQQQEPSTDTVPDNSPKNDPPKQSKSKSLKTFRRLPQQNKEGRKETLESPMEQDVDGSETETEDEDEPAKLTSETDQQTSLDKLQGSSTTTLADIPAVVTPAKSEVEGSVDESPLSSVVELTDASASPNHNVVSESDSSAAADLRKPPPPKMFHYGACPLCKDPGMLEPTAVGCFHVFCKACLEEIQQGDDSICPFLCRDPQETLRKLGHMEDAFRGVEVYCLHTQEKLHEFPTASAASVCFLSDRKRCHRIIQACRNPQDTFYGYEWRFQQPSTTSYE